jgi:cytochrome P450
LFSPEIIHKEHKPICKAVSFGLNCVSVCDIEFTKYFTKNPTLFTTDVGVGITEFIHDFFGNNILSAQGKNWHRQRVLLNQCFTDKALSCVHDATLEVSKKWMKLLEKNNRRNMTVEINAISTDVIGKACFDYDFELVDAISTDKRSYFTEAAIDIMSNMILVAAIPPFIRDYINFGPFGRVKKAVKYFNQRAIVETRRKLISENKTVPNDILSVMINATSTEEENVAPLTNEELSANCFIFMLAGQDT